MSTALEIRWNSYFYAGTNTLINKAGIRDDNVLERAEYKLTNERVGAIAAAGGMPGDLDIKHLQRIHEYLLGDLYEWAGQLRDVPLNKGSDRFADFETLPAQAAAIDQSLADSNYLRGLDKAAFTSGLAEHYAKLNKLHPFREGNGRSTRLFLQEIATSAGYVIDLAKLEANPDKWNSGARSANSGDLAGMTAIFKEAVRPARAISFEQLPKEKALAQHPELAPMYARLELRAQTLKATHPANAQAQDHFLAQTRSELVRELDRGDIRTLDKPTPDNAAKREAALMERARSYVQTSIKNPAHREAFLSAYELPLKELHRGPAKPELNR